MKEYTKPEFDIVLFSTEDVILTDSGIDDSFGEDIFDDIEE